MSKGFTPAAILLIVVVLILGGVVVYQNFLLPQANPTPTPAISPLPSAQSTPTVTSQPQLDETTDWKIYENTTYHYTIKAPNSYIARDSDTGYYFSEPNTACKTPTSSIDFSVGIDAFMKGPNAPIEFSACTTDSDAYNELFKSMTYQSQFEKLTSKITG